MNNKTNRIDIHTFGCNNWHTFSSERINPASNFPTFKSSMLRIQPLSNVLRVNMFVVPIVVEADATVEIVDPRPRRLLAPPVDDDADAAGGVSSSSLTDGGDANAALAHRAGTILSSPLSVIIPPGARGDNLRLSSSSSSSYLSSAASSAATDAVLASSLLMVGSDIGKTFEHLD